MLRGRAFAKFLIETVHKRLPQDVNHFIVVHPLDFNASAQFLEPYLDTSTHRDITPDQMGTLRPYSDFNSRYPKGHTLCIHPKCPRGHLFITLAHPLMTYDDIAVIRGSRVPLTPVRWDWNDLQHIAQHWPYLAPEYAAKVYPPPPQALDPKDAERALLAAAIDRPALAHWKSVALRSIIQKKYAVPRPEMGQGWYRTTELGCKALKVWKSSWARILDDG